VAEVSGWLLRNGLLLNPTKTQAIVFGTRQRLCRNTARCKSITVIGATVTFAQTLKIPGVTLESALTLYKRVSDVVRACNYHTRALRHIRPLLSVDSAKTVAAAIVGARLDYGNSILHGSSLKNLHCFQRVKNSLVRCACVVQSGRTVPRL
jgi:hypothetical protein